MVSHDLCLRTIRITSSGIDRASACIDENPSTFFRLEIGWLVLVVPGVDGLGRVVVGLHVPGDFDSSEPVSLDEAALAFAPLPSSDPSACVFFAVGGRLFALASMAGFGHRASGQC